MRRADVVKVSDEDLALPGTRPRAGRDSIRRWLDAGVRLVLRTGGAGAVAVHGRAGRTAVAVPAVAVVDTIGAGDAFGGGFLAAWIGRRPWAARLARRRRARRGASPSSRVTLSASGAEPPTVASAAGADPPRLAELERRVGCVR